MQKQALVPVNGQVGDSLDFSGGAAEGARGAAEGSEEVVSRRNFTNTLLVGYTDPLE